MSTEKHILVDHVKLVLFSRRLDSQRRTVALTEGHDVFGCGCPRKPHDAESKKALKAPPMFWPVSRTSVPAQLVRRVRMERGLKEVKRTWGVGYKAMLTAAPVSLSAMYPSRWGK